MSGYSWYIVQALSGYEQKVADAIKEKAIKADLSNKFEEITVPTEDVIEVRRGKKVNNKKKFFPGYVLVKMQLDDTTWHLVRSIPKVTGFLGGAGKPQPISEKEVNRIYKQIEEGLDKPKHAIMFEVAESVKIIDGPFDSFIGVVEEIDQEKGRLKVSVSIFGRSTPVELEYSQVEKV